MLKLKEQINFFTQENARQIDSLKKEQANQIDSLKKEHANQIDSLKKENANQIDFSRQENARIKDDFNRMVTILMKNESNIQEGLKSLNTTLQIIKTEFNIYKDCKELYVEGTGSRNSGVYAIYPFGRKITVFCDMVTEGGGWTVIQKRVSGSVRFNRNWTEYRTGFGSPNDSYWIGNDVIQQLTRGRNSSLYVSITLTNWTKLYELYNQFSVGDESDNYRLLLGGPATGTLGDTMLNTGNSGADLSGMAFSTLDRDHDRGAGSNCAVDHGGGGGWWYNWCHYAYLNGPWSPAYWQKPWYPTVTNSEEIKETLMMIKPH